MGFFWHEGVFSRIEQISHNTRLYFIKKNEKERPFKFKPGQFITLDLPIDSEPARRWRSYSIASAPDESNEELELVISYAEKGKGSQYLFHEAKIGDKVTFRGPQGLFILPKELKGDLFLICTGTGIAPFRAMLHSIRNTGLPRHQNIYMIFGSRRQEDLIYKEDMLSLEQSIEGFHYIPTLSREQWEGETGYVHPIYERLAKDKPEAQFYVCGWKEMIKEARQRIQAMGFNRKAFHQELYG